MAEIDTGRPQVLLVSRSVVLDNKRVLLIKRSSTDSHNPGQWECPGGKLEAGQDLSHAQEDEVMQEAGLLIIPASRLVYFDSYTVSYGKYAGLPYIVIFGIAYPVGNKTIALSEEHEDYSWVSYENALKMNLTNETLKAPLALNEYFK